MEPENTQHLILIRHAKTLQAVGRQSDIERELAEPGYIQGEHMRAHLAELNLPASALILCSPSTRTRQTLQTCLPEASNVEFVSEIYAAYTGDLLNLINDYLGNGNDYIVVVGHNPSLDSIVRWLGHNNDEALRGMATGCIASFTGTGQISPENWRLQQLFKPSKKPENEHS